MPFFFSTHAASVSAYSFPFPSVVLKESRCFPLLDRPPDYTFIHCVVYHLSKNYIIHPSVSLLIHYTILYDNVLAFLFILLRHDIFGKNKSDCARNIIRYKEKWRVWLQTNPFLKNTRNESFHNSLVISSYSLHVLLFEKCPRQSNKSINNHSS